VKAAYESNADTFVFNGVAKNKVEKITIANNINLDDLNTMASTAATTAIAAQTSANTANAAAATAQTTANNAATAAATAQSTAASKEDAFTEAMQQFTNVTGAANTDVSLTLTNAPKTGFQVQVFFNGQRVRNVSFTAGNTAITYNVPFITETTDHINVVYCH
jgi:hypothetical protein